MNKTLDYEFFSSYFKSFKSFDVKTFDLALEHVQRYADESGLTEEDLVLIAEIALKQQLGLSRMRKLIKCLLPRYTMPDLIVESVLDWFLINYNKNISPLIKKLILQWFIGLIEYKLIDPEKHINFYYDLFYYFVLKDIVNIPACKLIYLLTKPRDVGRWNVKQILKAHEKFNCPKYTGALLLLFKSYRPENVPENIPAYAVHKAFGTLPEFIINNFSKAQMRIGNNMITKDVDTVMWNELKKVNEKKNAIKLIPNVTESEIYIHNGSKTLLSVVNSRDLHKYLIASCTPNRVLSLLNNDEGSFILAFGNKELHERFNYQLYHTLHDAFLERNPYVSYKEKDKILYRLSLLQNQIQESIPMVSKFLSKFLVKWDGLEHEKNIYDLMSWIHFKSYDELKEFLLTFLYDLFISGTVQTKCNILSMLGQLSVNIIITYYFREIKKIPLIFSNTKIEWQFEDLIIKLNNYIIEMATIGLTVEKYNPLLVQTLIKIHENILFTEKLFQIHIWENSLLLCYCGLFTSNPTCLLRICKFFNKYPDYIDKNVRKDYIMCLFYRKAFTIKDKYSIFNNFAHISELKKLITNINNSLSWENHLALSCFNYTFKQMKKSKKYDVEDFRRHAEEHFYDVLAFLQQHFDVS